MKTDLKTLRPFQITVEHNGKFEKEIVNGYRVVVEGFEEFQFAVHKSSDSLINGKWCITELSTGFYVLGGSSAKALTSKIQNRLKKLGKEELQSAIQKALEQLKKDTTEN